MKSSLLAILEVNNILGECILWDAPLKCVWWTDIHSAVLYQYFPDTGAYKQHALPQRLGSFGLIEQDHRLICAFESGFALFDPRINGVQWLHKPEQAISGTRFNDGRVDRQGRFWSGTMPEGVARDKAGNPVAGNLYWTNGPDIRKAMGNIRIPNSLCWSPDSTTLYFADSPTREIRAYPFNATTGEFSHPTSFATIVAPGAPDGSTVDAEGFLWNAQWGNSKVVRYSPAGNIDHEIPLPVTQPTCLCFGGDNLDLLFITTARENLGSEALQAQPLAGSVFVYATSCRGLPESRFALADEPAGRSPR